jgi:23S rRNA (guanosine2251-2'-O)-methyltransferase
VPNVASALERARSKGLWVVGLDQEAGDDLWSSSLLDPPAGIVLGAEDRGLSTPVRDRCDGFVSIPSAGRLASLNVAAAGAVAMFEVARRARALARG